MVITATSHAGNGPASPEKMTADDVLGEFGPNGMLTGVKGLGHTAIVQTTANGTQQTTRGDMLVAHLAQAEKEKTAGRNAGGSGMQIESATVDGNVVLTQQPPPKAGSAQPALRATAGHADYDSNGEWLRLTRNPFVNDGGLELSADKLNVSQVSGDAFAQGNVKATWEGNANRGVNAAGSSTGKTKNGTTGLADFGAQGPTHVVSQEAQLQRSTGRATFKRERRACGSRATR